MPSKHPEELDVQRDKLMQSVRAIAHPLRIQIYEMLVLQGPMTVSAVAEGCSVAVGSASYHLLQLAQAGYVEEAESADREHRHDRRERWWRVSSGGLEWNPADLLGIPGGRELSSAAAAMLVERRARKLMEWASGWSSWPKEWIDVAEDSDTYLDLTPTELGQLSAELNAVIAKWSVHGREQGTDGERRRVFLALSAFPAKVSGDGDA